MEPGRDSRSVAMNAVKKPSTITQRIVQEHGVPWRRVEAASRLVLIVSASSKRLKTDVSMYIGFECRIDGVIEWQEHVLLVSQANHRSIECLNFQPTPGKQIKGHRPLCPRFQRF